MPPWVATLLVGGITVGTNLLVTAYYYGRLSQRVDTHEKEISEGSAARADQWRHINDTRADVAKIKGKLGINGQ
jgi:hypothetical protein